MTAIFESTSSLVKSVDDLLRQPAGIALVASLGVHGLLALSLPFLSVSSGEDLDAERTVEIVELTPAEQRRLPQFATPQAPGSIPQQVPNDFFSSSQPPSLSQLPPLDDPSLYNVPFLPPPSFEPPPPVNFSWSPPTQLPPAPTGSIPAPPPMPGAMAPPPVEPEFSLSARPTRLPELAALPPTLPTPPPGTEIQPSPTPETPAPGTTPPSASPAPTAGETPASSTPSPSSPGESPSPTPSPLPLPPVPTPVASSPQVSSAAIEKLKELQAERREVSVREISGTTAEEATASLNGLSSWFNRVTEKPANPEQSLRKTSYPASYPNRACIANLNGTVRVAALIGPDGRAVEAPVIVQRAKYKIFNEAALDSIAAIGSETFDKSEGYQVYLFDLYYDSSSC